MKTRRTMLLNLLASHRPCQPRHLTIITCPGPISILQGPSTNSDSDQLQQRSSKPHRKVSADRSGLGRHRHSFIPRRPPRSVLVHNLTSIILLHACQLAIQTPSLVGSLAAHACTRLRMLRPKETSRTGHVYGSTPQIHWLSRADEHTRALLHTCSAAKVTLFTAGQCDNASDLDKQPAVKVAGYKSGLLSSGD